MPAFPKRVAVELTNYCNLSCPVCPRHHMQMVCGTMDWELWTKIVDEIAQHDCTLIPAWRGELFCHPYAAEMLYYAGRRVKSMVVVTNGVLVGEFTLPVDLLGYVDQFNVSIQGQSSLDGLRYINAYMCKDVIQVSRVEGPRPRQDVWAVATALSDSQRTYKQHTINGKWGQVAHRPIKPRRWCNRLDTDLCIAWDGQISRCCYVWECLHYPNVKASDIETIWKYDLELRAIRENYPDGVCEECDQWAGGGSTL